MRIVQFAAAALVLMVISAVQPRAEQPDLLGSWSAQAEILLERNDEIVKVPRMLTMVIDRVDGNLFFGRRLWEALTDDPGNVAGRDVLEASEPFIGAIDSDGVTLRIVETDDPGIMFGELLGPNRMEITYMESYPHAVIYTVILIRQKE